MSLELNKNYFFETLENDITNCRKNKKLLNEAIRDFKFYINVFYEDYPIQKAELLTSVRLSHENIHSKFFKTTKLLGNINNRLKKFINNLFLNIDINDFREILSRAEDYLTTIHGCIYSFSDSNKVFKSDSADPNFVGPYNIIPPEFSQVFKHSTDSLNEILSLFEIVIDYLEKLNNKILEIEEKINEYSDSNYQKRLEEDTNLILKKFENQISNLIKTYENQVKRFNLDIKDSTESINIAKGNVENVELKNSELSSKLSGYERRLQQITDSRAEDIKIVLQEKLDNLETITNEKISAIDQSYLNAQKNHQKFKELVEKAGVYNLIVNYKEKAEEEKKEYKTYRKYTSRALYWAIGFTIFILGIPLVEHWLASQPVSIDYYSILVRLTISLMFLVLALFFSKQAAKHYECHQENNRTFLQLAALEPFMANMSPADQLAIRKQLVPTYFNQNADGKFASKGDEIDISTNMHNLLSQVISVVAERKDPKPSTNETETPPSSK